MGCLIGLAGCVGLEPGYKSKITKESYVVQKGDTLYSIAFRYGVDYKSLAQANGVKPPYTIYLNQRLSLKNVSVKTSYDSGPNGDASPRKASKKKNKVSKKRRGASVDWSWPLRGEVLNTFSLSFLPNLDFLCHPRQDLLSLLLTYYLLPHLTCF